MEHADVVIVGAGAAGLMTAIQAGRRAERGRIVLLDGAAKPGAKILVAGGGRCNVTHYDVRAEDFAGSSRNAIRKVLRRFDVAETVAFFADLGVELKREETGKLFPVTDSARTVLNALLGAVRDAGVEFRYPHRVQTVRRVDGRFEISGDEGRISADRVVLATGGKSLPRTGSDGHGLGMARSLGHSVTDRVFPGLVPLTLPRDDAVCALSGITVPATLTLRRPGGKRIVSFTDSTLCTHFGLSGPSVLNISRYWVDASADDPTVELVINWMPGMDGQDVERLLLGGGKRSAARVLSEHVPQRLAESICTAAGAGSTPCASMPRDTRRALVRLLTEMPLSITGNRGFRHAEVTAGGVPLSELELKTMASRCCPGLHLVGEMCDVDGRIGGFNFQWAWASGYVAGTAAGAALMGADAGVDSDGAATSARSMDGV